MASIAKRTWTHKDITKTAWVVRYTDQGDKRRLKTFQQKKEADRYRTKVETEIEKGLHTPESESVTVAEARELWLEKCEQRLKSGDQMRRRTLVNYRSLSRKHIVPFLGATKLPRLSALVIQDWVDKLAFHETAPRGHRVIEAAITQLCTIISDAQRRGYVSVNIVKQARPRIPVKRPGRVEIRTKHEVRLMLNESTARLRLVLHMAVFTGMRQGEIFGLTWDNVDFNAREIKVRQSIDRWHNFGPPKSESGIRDIPMAPHLMMMLKEWRLACPNTDENVVFPNKLSRPDTGENFYKSAWSPFARRIGLINEKGLPKYHFHAFRHIAASLFIEQDLQPKQIQTVMGHASITMTFDRYGHLFKDNTDVHTALVAIEADLLG